jgi:16S rRNA (cytosine967-C5)-methyltransferase
VAQLACGAWSPARVKPEPNFSRPFSCNRPYGTSHTARNNLPVSPARQIAFQILCRVESGKEYAVDLLQSERVSHLKESDRKLATELVMGVLRWRGDLDCQLERLSRKQTRQFDLEVLVILRLGIYQIRLLRKIPKGVAVNESVELVKLARKRSAAGLVNAVLRQCEPLVATVGREEATALFGPTASAGQEMADSACRSVPGWLFERWVQNFGLDSARALAWATVGVPRTTLRLQDTSPEYLAEMRQQLSAAGVRTRPGRFAATAVIVEAGNIRSIEALRMRRLAIQDEGSQIVGSLVAPQAGQTVLDLCAAPGIKTSQIAAALGRGTLVACDSSPRRLTVLRKLLHGMLPDTVRLGILRLDATRDLPFARTFDRILVDAPCSGTGTLGRNPEIKWRLRSQDLTRLREVQVALLKQALTVLAEGGRLVYSTCSLEPAENEQVVEGVLAENRGFQMLGREVLAQEFPHVSPLFEERGYLRTRPDLHDMDGFFAVVITHRK